jgi:hypothetical protein
LPFYGAKFLENHAGRIVQDPDIAVTELVATSWDARASRVDITWPTQAGDAILVSGARTPFLKPLWDGPKRADDVREQLRIKPARQRDARTGHLDNNAAARSPRTVADPRNGDDRVKRTGAPAA